MDDNNGWWNEFFSGSWSAIQQRGYPKERTCAEVDFIAGALEVAPGDSLLDIPCGIGRHAIEFAARGFDVTGVDFSARALAKAAGDAAAEGVNVQLMEADMREVEFDRTFDSAYCFFGSFGYFDDAGNLQMARSVRRALRDGGKFLIDTHLVETLLPKFRPRDWYWTGEAPEEGRLLEERTWDASRGRVDSIWTFLRGEEVTESRTSIRVYTFREAAELLFEAGFGEVRAIETMTAESLRIGAQRVSVIANAQ